MEAPQGGYFLPISKRPYPKQTLTIEEHLALLQQRGMTIDDATKANHYLAFIGYYRLSGYTRYFLDPADPKGEKFAAGTTFQQVLDLYIFDRKIRVLLLDALERIEIAVKSKISNSGSLEGQRDPFWLEKADNFDRGVHGEIMAILRARLSDNGKGLLHQFITHFFTTYSEPLPPCWMAMEALSFGEISNIYKRLKGTIRLRVAPSFGTQHDVLESWLHALAFGRNLCAHHARVWNQRFVISPKIPRQYRGIWPEGSQEKLYIFCAVIQHMLGKISPNSDWAGRLRSIINTRPNVPLSEMGFPVDWETKAFWKFS